MAIPSRFCFHPHVDLPQIARSKQRAQGEVESTRAVLFAFGKHVALLDRSIWREASPRVATANRGSFALRAENFGFVSLRFAAEIFECVRASRCGATADVERLGALLHFTNVKKLGYACVVRPHKPQHMQGLAWNGRLSSCYFFRAPPIACAKHFHHVRRQLPPRRSGVHRNARYGAILRGCCA